VLNAIEQSDSLDFAMQNIFNSVKSSALGVAEYLTPVLKVKLKPPIPAFYICLLFEALSI